MKKYIYAIYHLNKYPECCHEPDKEINAIFESKTLLNKAIKELSKKYPVSYGKDAIKIEKIELNKFFTF